MAGKRNCITNLIEYIKSLGIEINYGTNKARGNKGFFRANRANEFRIDISKELSDSEVLNVLVHEFMHYVHFKSDKTLKSTKFIFGNNYNEYEEDLIKLTVDSVPKAFAQAIFKECERLKNEIKSDSNLIKGIYPDFKLSEKYKPIEKSLAHSSCKYLLKYDRVKVFENFQFKIYSIKNLNEDFPQISDTAKLYIKLRAKQRVLKRLHSKISRLNKYYNNPSELIARSFEYYVTNPEFMKIKTPKLYDYYKNFIQNNNNELITNMLSAIDR